MPRLPVPGSDDNVWGDVLNTYLLQSLAADGTINSTVVGTTQLQDTAVTTAKLGLSAATTTAIADSNVTKTKLATAVQASLDKADTALQTAPVTSVATRTGDVLLTKSDAGLDQVDNTSDVNKPISTATQAALDATASTTFDITKSHPRFMAALAALTQAAVSRTTIRSPDTREYYASQFKAGSNGTTTPYTTTVINHMGVDGVYLDSMSCTDGGSGFGMELEYSGGQIYIWMAYQAPLGAGGEWDLVRFPYVAGATITRSDVSVQTMNKFTTDYVAIAFDWQNDHIAIAHTPNGTNPTFELRKISELKAGTNIVYNTMNLSVDMTLAIYNTGAAPTFRGFATLDDKLYINTGAPNNPTSDPQYITVYDWTTGTQYTQISTAALGASPNGTYPGNAYEQGGCSIYRDSITGEVSLLLAVTLDVGSNHAWNLYVYPSIASDSFISDQLFRLEDILPYDMSLKAQRMNGTATSIAMVTGNGWWYFTSTEMQAMTDAPSTYVSTDGYFLEVSGMDVNTAIRQTLYRNSTVSPDKYVRIIASNGTVSKWIQEIRNNISGIRSGPDVSDQGYLGWSFPPEYIQTGVKTQYNGGLNGVKIRIPTACTITNLIIGVTGAISSGTAGANGLALYDAAGNLLGSCGDMTSTWGSIGVKTVPLATPVAVPPGYVIVAFWSTVSAKGNATSPSFYNAENIPLLGLFDDNLTAGNYRYFLGATSGVTSAPATIGTQSLCGTAWWVAVS